MPSTAPLPIISVAPMMDCTDRHDRYFLRLIAPDVRLYTEMITAQALMHGDVKRLLAMKEAEKYVALQLGGSQPQHLGQGARLGQEHGYDEINLNVGCPSPRVSAGRFGACLMLEPELVAECVSAMRAKTTLPVTVKCRIGVDDNDSDEALHHFIQTVSEAGCKTFIVHARKAWLSGLSPKQNRDIPPLRYEAVRRVKRDFPHLSIIINGGFKSLLDIEVELPFVDGVMIGRAAYANPYLLAHLQSSYFPGKPILTRHQVVQKLLPYIQEQLALGVKLATITRHLFGLFQGQRGAAAWRRYLSEQAHQADAGVDVVEKALSLVTDETIES
jgi:tRNA-dihydrouridine synthase A